MSQQTATPSLAATVAPVVIKPVSMRVAGPVPIPVPAPAGPVVRGRTVPAVRGAPERPLQPTARMPARAIVPLRTPVHATAPAPAVAHAGLRAAAPSRAPASVHPHPAAPSRSVASEHPHPAVPSPAVAAVHAQRAAVSAKAVALRTAPLRQKPRVRQIARPVVALRGSAQSANDRRIGARGSGPLGRAQMERRPAPARAASIIEPPLGYDGQPTLVVAPGAAQLELGEIAIPTIRSRRRH